MSLSDSLKKFGSVLSSFNPVLGGSVILVSDIVDYFNVYPDNVLESNVTGLSKSASIIKRMVKDDNFDKDKLLEISENLEAMNEFVSKFQKVLK
jgi:hypothetical protein